VGLEPVVPAAQQAEVGALGDATLGGGVHNEVRRRDTPTIGDGNSSGNAAKRGDTVTATPNPSPLNTPPR